MSALSLIKKQYQLEPIVVKAKHALRKLETTKDVICFLQNLKLIRRVLKAGELQIYKGRRSFANMPESLLSLVYTFIGKDRNSFEKCSSVCQSWRHVTKKKSVHCIL